ncbi:glyoxalase [Hymenobacter aerilatus]|uniref:Glyoxalase n=1 Tax=Hymenobacter aerilatus TaxID=2932251 RepID=A0A8T9SYC4_9BACT|nr:glyoxalase [Hymenobacter aerilatus]UOR06865.1 glyoxalase [Hymenobacter aerilatus]
MTSTEQKILSLRPFIGAKDVEVSRRFYRDFGFLENTISPTLFYYSKQGMGFYLQDAYVKEWVDNTMLFLQVDDVEQYRVDLLLLRLPEKYATVQLSAIRTESWGKEFSVHDPSGILWHIGQFHD